VADEIRVSFPEGSGVPDLVLPLAEVKVGEKLNGFEHDDVMVQSVNVGNWWLERDVTPEGKPLSSQEETDAHPAYIEGAISAWATWWLWLQQENKAQATEVQQ
jgi:hypothetical protein